eukprot:TRINITY_DN9398_c0_g1_i1.p1 TRINITY_DN9398_c0_g1~~TRINITY_DN9398_c0_g1_i1.p1  ORF type:complete len:100 (-),score=16.62 TRINITY_DN9398_c0_g1_i1:76-375(-)
MTSITSNWMKTVIDFNPRPLIKAMKCPSLCLLAAKDSQVLLEQNLPSWEESNSEVMVYENANHLFREAKTGLPDEYQSCPKEFVDGFLEKLIGWIKALQ